MKLNHVEIGKTYINLKKRTPYLAIAFAVHSEDMTGHIVYMDSKARSLRQWLSLWLFKVAARLNQTRVWIRPIGLFEEKFYPAQSSFGERVPSPMSQPPKQT